MAVTVVEPPWEVNTPRGKGDVLAIIDYSQESYVYFLTAARGTGEFWVYKNTECTLFWDESTGLGKKPEEVNLVYTHKYPASEWGDKKI
jgi:hypothetical protein